MDLLKKFYILTFCGLMSQAGQAAFTKRELMLAREAALSFPFTRFSGSGEPITIKSINGTFQPVDIGVRIQKVSAAYGSQLSRKSGRLILDLDPSNMKGVTFRGAEIFVRGAYWQNFAGPDITTYNESDSIFLEPEDHKEGDAPEATSESRGLENKQAILGHHDIIGDASHNEDNRSQMNLIENDSSEKELPNHPAISEHQDDVSSQNLFSEDDAKGNSREHVPHYPIPVPVQTRPWLFKSNASQPFVIPQDANTGSIIVLKKAPPSYSHEQVWVTKKDKGLKGFYRKIAKLFRFKKHKDND
jgi:hypothetical protein